MKTCTGCGRLQPLKSYAKHLHTKDGLQSQCRTCQQAVANELVRTRKAIILEHLLEHPCVDCGESDPIVLEFDHVRGTKIKNVSDMVRSKTPIKRLLEEIDKCEVRCANCHRRITHKRRIENQTPVTPLPSKQEKG